jgi:glycerophosphoryl diester phosphodiesterase
MATQLHLPDKTKPYLMAHRGNKAHCPENTLASFRRALAEGADIIETDLHLSADGVFMCIHDATLERTTNGSGAVAEKTLAELKTLSASCGQPEYASERIPTLAELCALLPPDVALALELKSDRFLETAVGRQLAQELEAAGVSERTVILSFSLARLQAVQAAAPHLPAGWITIQRVVPLGGVQLLGPLWLLLAVNPLYVWLAHRRGQLVCPLDPAPDKRLWWYKLLGCDAVLSDDPGATRRALGQAPAK